MMKAKNNGGFSLVEVMISIVLLAAITIPVCTGMVVAPRVNAKAEAMLRAKIAVSSAVETMMAKGYSEKLEAELEANGLIITASQDDGKDYYYNVEVADAGDLVRVSTSVRADLTPEQEGEGTE